MAEKLNREAMAGAECPSCGGALWMQSQDCCVKAVEVKEEVAVEEEVVEEAPAEELCEKCGKDPCACEEEKTVEKPKKKTTPKKKAAKKA